MSTTQEAGFEIRGRFYPMPDAFRLCDPVLVSEVTGMNFNDFAEAIDDEDRREDPVILVGLVAVAIWQQHRTWPRAKVVKFLQQVNVEELEAHAGEDDDEQEVEQRPPDGSSSTSSSISTTPPAEEPAPEE